MKFGRRTFAYDHRAATVEGRWSLRRSRSFRFSNTRRRLYKVDVREDVLVKAADQMITFGPYRLDRASGRLLHGAANVPLRRKTFTVLEYLASRPGRLIAREELLDAMWPATSVTPSVLSGCIRELRRALGDDARVPRFVETAHRRGYRFIAAATEIGAAVDDPSSRSRIPVPTLNPETELADLARWFANAVARLATDARRPPVTDPRHRPATARRSRYRDHRRGRRGKVR